MIDIIIYLMFFLGGNLISIADNQAGIVLLLAGILHFMFRIYMDVKEFVRTLKDYPKSQNK